MRILLLSFIAVAFAACAQSPTNVSGAASSGATAGGSAPANGRDCFNVSFVTGYESLGANAVRLDAGPSAQYDVTFSGAQCNQLDWTHRLALESTQSSWICVGAQAGQGNISFRDPTTRRRVSCYIENVTRGPQSPSQGS